MQGKNAQDSINVSSRSILRIEPKKISEKFGRLGIKKLPLKTSSSKQIAIPKKADVNGPKKKLG